MENNGSTAIITGATSGIGKEFACRFAEKGYNLIITGRRKSELKKVAKAISTDYRVDVQVIIGDLADQQYRQELCNRIKEACDIDALVNNAGFGIDQSFYTIAIEEIRSMILTHTLATVELTHAVLPGMIERRRGMIINVSSLGAFMPGLTRSLYLGTKSFVHYFTEALSTEVRPLGIRIQSLCPGMTRSDFHRNMQNEKLEKKLRLIPFMSPEEVVNTSLVSVEKGRIFCIPGAINKLFYFIAKVLPVRVFMQIAGFRKEDALELNPLG
ncbi:MAG: SDR family oxidoreductase [Bacteroidetes bacterium]|nr:MAG: SDR family oxidoreductase [Bacteroidota bacterium]